MKCLLVAINAKYIHSNPGVYSLKRYAEQQGGLEPEEADLPYVRVEVAEYTINNQTEQILADIYRRKPEIVGISCYIWNVRCVMELVRDLHRVLPDTDIWLGGPEVSFDAPQLLEREPELLGVMKGEGEETFAELMQCYRAAGQSARRMQRAVESRQTGQNLRECMSQRLEQFQHQLAGLAGVTWRTGEGIIKDHPPRPAMDLNRLPFLYTLPENPEEETGVSTGETIPGFEHRILYYESSRGCPFSCSYCLSSIEKSVRFRRPELVKQELQVFLDRRVPQVKFVDRTFNCKKSHAMEIWTYIKEHDNGVTNFHFEIAADLLDEDALRLIGQMRPGLIQLEIGVQSTNPRTIAEIHRKMDLNKVRQVVARINAGHNVHQHLDLIAGLPYEDYNSFRNSFNEVYEMEPEQLQLGFLKVLKGSCMYETANRYGLKYRSLPPYEVLSTRWLSYEDVLKLKGVEDMVEVYYNSGQFRTTLKLLRQEFEDAFGMFETMAHYYEKKDLNGRNHSRLARYEILHAFAGEILQREHMASLEDALMRDLYLRENAKSRPGFAPEQASSRERIRALAPEARTLGAQVHVEAMQSGEIWLFDYRRRDPLNHNAMQVRLA